MHCPHMSFLRKKHISFLMKILILWNASQYCIDFIYTKVSQNVNGHKIYGYLRNYLIRKKTSTAVESTILDTKGEGNVIRIYSCSICCKQRSVEYQKY